MAKILIVEDKTLIRFSLADALIDAGHVVIDCANVLEAVAALARHDTIEAVVTDVDMPGNRNGLDLAGLVRKMRPSLSVFVTSGRTGDMSNHAGAAFLAKPYDFAALVELVSQAVDRNRQTASQRQNLAATHYRAAS